MLESTRTPVRSLASHCGRRTETRAVGAVANPQNKPRAHHTFAAMVWPRPGLALLLLLLAGSVTAQEPEMNSYDNRYRRGSPAPRSPPPPPRSPPPPPPPSSFVIAVHHQPAGEQPYARGCNSKSITIAAGTGAAAVSYSFTIDTGSGLPLLTCKAPASDANCAKPGPNGLPAPFPKGLPAATNYVLTPDKVVTGQQACSACGAGGCTLPGSGECFVSESLTGGNQFNINNGLFARDTLSFPDTLKAAPVSLNATFGCALAYIQCQGDSSITPCYNTSTTCPASLPGAAGLDGGCPGSNNGIEAGWTFNVGGPPSVLAVPQQVYDAGLIKEQVTGLCFRQPQKNLNCAAPLTSNSAVVLGSALPKGVRTSDLSSAPLIPAIFPDNYPPPPGTATPYTHTFRSNVLSASVAAATPGAPPVNFTFEGVSVLWDSGAYGQATVPANLFGAWLAVFNARISAAVAAAAKRGWQLTNCTQPAQVCGTNIGNTPATCLNILLPPNTPAADVAAARRLLTSPYPPPVSITLEGGAVARLPSAFPVHLCTGANNTVTSGVAVCSYIQPSPPPPGYYFWLAGPWFNNRFVRFNSSGPMQSFSKSVGTVSWSDTLSSCEF